MDGSELRVLLVDDDEDDFIITEGFLSEIEGQRFSLTWVSSYEVALDTIKRDQHDIYLLDYRLGEHNGLDLLRKVVANGCTAPIILLTGQGDHDVDVEATKAGAMDYLVKSRIDAAVLERSIRYAVERNRVERRLENLVVELEDALNKIKTLSGLLPICSHCKSIRDDGGYWNRLETYIASHSDAEFSHSLCPDCLRQHYPDMYKRMNKESSSDVD